MKRLLILLALAGLSAAACGDDDDKGGTKPTQDAGGPDAQAAQDGGNTTLDAAVALVSNVGAQCSVSSTTDCTGTGARCLEAVPELNATFQGGYCTATCSNNAECGATGGCPVGEAAGEFSSLLSGISIPGDCMLRCTAPTECRTGYTCTTIAAALPPALSAISAFLPPSLSEKYCLPPVSIALPEGGFPLPPRDSGVSDAGAVDAGDAGGTTADAGIPDAGDDSDAGPDATL